jgi:hypothetical protein
VYRYITDRRTVVFLEKLVTAQLDKKFSFIMSPVHCYAQYRCILFNINIAFSYDEELLVPVPPQSLQTAYGLPSANAYSTYMLLLSISRDSFSPIQRHQPTCGDICRTYKYRINLDVRGSVHHSIIHIKSPTRCNSVSKFYFIFI